jgi:hypothetical protein
MNTLPDPSALFQEELKRSEEQFGSRTRHLATKVEPRDGIPETAPDGVDGCIVYFQRAAAKDWQKLRFQLAHEAVHVLSGGLRRDATRFEEGLAVWFSLHANNREYRQRAERELPAMFRDAYNLFKKLEQKYEMESHDKIKALRQQCPDLDNVNSDILIKIFEAPQTLADALCRRVSKHMQDRLS